MGDSQNGGPAGTSAAIPLPAVQGVWAASGDAIGDPTCVVSRDGRIVAANRAFLAIYAPLADGVIGVPLCSLVSDESTASGTCLLCAALADGEPARVEIESDDPHNPFPHPIELVLTPHRAARARGAVTVVVRDLTERRTLENELRGARRDLEEAQRIGHMGNWVHDLCRNELTWSDETYRIFGLRPQEFRATYEAFLEAVHPDDRELVNNAYTEAVEAGVPYDVVHRVRRPDGEVRWVHERAEDIQDATGRTIRSVGTVLDITQQIEAEIALRAAESQVRQLSKMDAVGRLAGGIAHDFNNLMTIVIGAASLLRLKLEDQGGLGVADCDLILGGGQRAAALTRQLLAFSRKQVLAVVDPGELVRGVEKLLVRLLPENVELVLDLDPDAPAVLVDPGQLEQVIVNLAVNARDAMGGAGQLTMRAYATNLALEPILTELGLPPGDYLALAISDTGCGMDGATAAQVFEPFFTTKGPGEGTGLGLSTVYGIVKQSGGAIGLRTSPGRGTTFTVYLPQTDRAVEPSVIVAPQAPYRDEATETLLVVEDEKVLLDLTARMLRDKGYQILPASDAEAALAVAEEHEGKIHLLLTDVVMPGMNGPELAAAVCARHPEARVMYMSGYTGDVIGHHGIVDQRTHFVWKPFTPATLAAKVRNVLDS